MEPHQGDFDVETPDQMIAWAAQRDIAVRGERAVDLSSEVRGVMITL